MVVLLVWWAIPFTIDIRDYVNRIGNRSREPYICVHTLCYSLHPVANKKLAKKWPKIGTAAPLSINNSKTEEVPSLSQAYSSERVISLNVDNEDGASKPLCYSLQSHKVQEAKWPIFRHFRSLLAH